MTPTITRLKGRKLIKCPHCRDLLMDVDRNEKVELFILPTRKRISYREVKVCATCNRTLGYNLIAPAAQN